MFVSIHAHFQMSVMWCLPREVEDFLGQYTKQKILVWGPLNEHGIILKAAYNHDILISMRA